MAEAAIPDVSLSSGHDAIFDIECVPCSADGHYKQAEGYCLDGCDNLCADCVRDHVDVRSLKLHTLMNKVRNVKNMSASHVANIKLSSAIGNKNFLTRWVFNKVAGNIISGLAIVSNYTLAVTEFGNCVIRLIDTTANADVSVYIPDNRPWDVTACKDTIAVTFPGVGKIMFLKYARGLVYDREISVNGSCRGIDWYDDKLYVIYNAQKKLEVMTLTGVVLQTFTTSILGEHLFKDPLYVTVSASNQRIYVSDWETCRIVALGMDGKLKGVYEDSELGHPMQLAVDGAGVMYLCDQTNNMIHLLSPDGETVKILLTRQDGVESPFALSYCENTGLLYVAMSGVNTIKVYKISTK